MMWSPALKSCGPALGGGAPDRMGGGGWKIRTALSRVNVILSAEAEYSRRREVREGFLEEVEFKTRQSLDTNAGTEMLGLGCVLYP